MTTDNSTTKAVNDRLYKAKGAWATLRRSFITNKDLPIKHRIIILHASIGSILLYSLHCHNITKTNTNRLQSFYSKCIREIIYGIHKFDPPENHTILTSLYELITIYPQLKANFITLKSIP